MTRKNALECTLEYVLKLSDQLGAGNRLNRWGNMQFFRFQIELFRKTVIYPPFLSSWIGPKMDISRQKWIFGIFTFCFRSSDPSEYSSVESDESYSFDFVVLRTSFDLPRFDLGSDFVLRDRVAWNFYWKRIENFIRKNIFDFGYVFSKKDNSNM